MPPPTATLPLADEHAVTLTPDGDGWACAVAPESGAAERLVDALRAGRALTAPGFRLERHAVPPAASGERPMGVDQTNISVVVGERVVVKWLLRVKDAPHPAPEAVAHLAHVGFPGVPESYGVLLWRAPSGREVPCAIAAAYLPSGQDGWTWATELAIQAVDGSCPADVRVRRLPSRLGRLAAQLHDALATPSPVLPAPIGAAADGDVARWQETAERRLARALAAAPALDGAPAGPDGDGPPPVPPSKALRDAAPALAEAVAGLAAVAGGDPRQGDLAPLVQRVHGDLHVGQVLRWSGGLAVVDFDGSPLLAAEDAAPAEPELQPAARDLAQLLVSVDQAGRIADRRSGWTRTADVDAWSTDARAELLDAYRGELTALGREEILDERLIRPFVAEQICRDLLYAERFLPRWAYAAAGGVHLLAG